MEVSILLCLFFTLTSGLYEDQVGDSDWHQSFLGSVSWTSFDNLSGGRRKILLASESGVLAAVNAASGKIAWRQELEKDHLFAITHYRSYLLTVSGNVNLIVRSWDIESGLLKWEVPTVIPAPTVQNGSLDNQLMTNGVLLELTGNKKDQLILVSNSVMSVHSTRSGKEQWSITLPSSGTPLLSVDGSLVRVWLLGDQKLSFLQYDIAKGQAPPTESYVLSNEEISQETECILLMIKDDVMTPLCTFRNNRVYLVSTKDNELHRVEIENEALLTEPIQLMPGPTGHVHIGSSVYHLIDNVFKQVCTDCQIGVATSEKGDLIRIIVHASGQTIRIQNTVYEDELTVSDQQSRGGIAKMKILSFHKSDGSLAWRIVIIREDASVSVLSQTGSIVWTREDGLGNIIASEMADLPSAQFEAEGLLTLLAPNANPFIQAITRWRIQANLFQDSVKDIVERGVASLLQPLSSEDLLRDKFNMRKVIVTMTAHNKVYGLDSSNGKILWQLYLPIECSSLSDDYRIYTLRTSSHPPHPPQMLIIGKGCQCNGSVLFLFNPIDGELINEDSSCLSRNIAQTLLLPILDKTHSRVLVYLDDNDLVGCYPNGCGDISLNDLNIFMYTANTNTGILKGYKINEENEQAVAVWQIVLSSNEKILLVANKAFNDHAHSMGRVRANRAVQFKYLNPNTVAVVTKSFDQPTKSSLSVYLIDSVNGGVIYRSSHRLASDPAGLILCENWILFHYFSIKSQRNELAVIELYDARNNTESVWSSLAPPTLPVISSQGYIFPTSIVTIATTITHKGITPKSLLLGLPSGHILSLRKDILDPRREIIASQQMVDEGVPAYIPDIPIYPRSYINYNQTVARISGIHASATGLESTSLVFAYGLDLYVTRVQPSGQFDLLAEDFDYLLIAGVVLVLILATLVMSWLANRKTLNSLWK